MLAILIALHSLSAQAGWFGGPSNYDECIFESMKGVKSNVAARAIIQSCKSQFSSEQGKATKTRGLTANEVKLITGRASHSFGNHFSGNLYNGNPRVVVTNVGIAVITKISGKESTTVYTTDVNIPPLTTIDFGFDIVTGDQGAKYSWVIVGAVGHDLTKGP